MVKVQDQASILKKTTHTIITPPANLTLGRTKSDKFCYVKTGLVCRVTRWKTVFPRFRVQWLLALHAPIYISLALQGHIEFRRRWWSILQKCWRSLHTMNLKIHWISSLCVITLCGWVAVVAVPVTSTDHWLEYCWNIVYCETTKLEFTKLQRATNFFTYVYRCFVRALVHEHWLLTETHMPPISQQLWKLTNWKFAK